MTRQRGSAGLLFLGTVICTIYIPAIVFLLFDSLSPSGGEGVSVSSYIALFGDSGLLEAISLTAVVVFFSVGIQLALAILFALMCVNVTPGSNIFAKVIAVSYFVPTSCLLMIWVNLTNPFTGPLSLVLESMGFELDFRSETIAPFLTIAFSTMEGLGFCFLVILARLWQLPEHYRDLSIQFGGTSIATFRYFVWPHIRAVVLVLLGLRIFISISKFDAPWLAFARLRSSVYGDTYGIWVYRNQFETGQTGVAAASIVLFLLLVTLFILVMKSGRQERLRT